MKSDKCLDGVSNKVKIEEWFILLVEPKIGAIKRHYPDSLRATRKARIAQCISGEIRLAYGGNLPNDIVSELRHEVIKKLRAVKCARTKAANSSTFQAVMPRIKAGFIASLQARLQANEHIVPIDDEHPLLIQQTSF